MIQSSNVNGRSFSDEITQTYAFPLSYSYQNLNLTSDETDGSISITVYLTLNIKKRNSSDGSTAYLLTSVSGTWDILDDNASIVNGYLTYGCVGAETSSQVTRLTIYDEYQRNTGFTTYVDELGAIVGHTLDLTLHYQGPMGATREWNFYTEYFPLQNLVPGWPE